MDTSKSLAELTGIDWGPAPAQAPLLIRERHEYRRTTLKTLSNEGLIRLLSLGDALEILIPVAFARLRQDPDLVGLLATVLAAQTFPWRSHTKLVRQARETVSFALNDTGQMTDDLERLHAESKILWPYSEFERRLSGI